MALLDRACFERTVVLTETRTLSRRVLYTFIESFARQTPVYDVRQNRRPVRFTARAITAAECSHP